MKNLIPILFVLPLLSPAEPAITIYDTEGTTKWSAVATFTFTNTSSQWMAFSSYGNTIPEAWVLAPGRSIEVKYVGIIVLGAPIVAPGAVTMNAGQRADMDNDGDVDMDDWISFQECFNGPNNTPACK